MLGRDHLVANTASLAILGVGTLELAQQPPVSPIGALAPIATTVLSALTRYGGVNGAAVVGLGLVFFYVGTLLPDIDSERSLLGRHLHLPFEHRTWTHAIWFPLVFFITGFVFPSMWWLTLGYVLHLFWDALSRGGVCWFYPFSRYISYDSGAKVKAHHRLKLYRVGSMSEYVLTGGLVVIAVVCVCAYLGVFGG